MGIISQKSKQFQYFKSLQLFFSIRDGHIDIKIKGGIKLTHKRIMTSLVLILLFVLSGCFGSKPSTLTKIEISPASFTAEIGKNQTFVLVGKDQNDNALSCTATWSLNNGHGELNTSEGSSVTFIPKTVGEVTLTAQSGNLTAKAEITVSPEPPIPTQLVVEPNGIRFGQSEIQEIQVSMLDQYGNVLNTEIQSTWEVTNQLGTFNQVTGNQVIFTGNQAGEGMITVTVKDISADIPVIVEAPAEIPDTALRNVLLNEVGKTNGSLFPYELEKITSIQANQKGIAVLNGLEYCINLIELVLSKNEDISDLAPIANLNQLVILNINHNYFIRDLDPLKSLTKLETLEAWGLWKPDPTPISHLAKLKILNLQESGIQASDFLSTLLQLETLKLGGNRIEEISSLENLNNLTRLYLDGNLISDITVLNKLPSLEYLGLTQNLIPDEMIWNLPAETKANLKELGIGNLNLTDTDLTNLSAFTNLERLDISGNQLTHLTPLTDLSNLQHLFAQANQISNINALQSLQQLKTIRLEINSITDLTPLVNNEGLSSGDYLGIWDNSLDLTIGSPVQEQIDVLKSRGVFVDEEAPNNYNMYQYLNY